MNRRDFARLSALSLAASQLPRVGEAQASGKIGFAVIGLGTIARQFLEQIANSSTVECTALVTGHPDTKGPDWKQKFNLPNAKVYTYETMDQLRSNAAVQAVYVATPNALHLRDTLAAARAGKHVLCEKPMAISSAQCKTMIDACRAANVKLMIGYRMQYEPVYLKAREMVQNGALGKIAAIEGAFGFSAQPGVWRLTKALGGGGAVFDVGIYPLNAIRFLLGEEPTSYTAAMSTTDTTSGRFKEMEETTAWTMTFGNGALAACTTSYGVSIPGMLRLHGEKGMLDFQNAYSNGRVHLTGRTTNGKVDEGTEHEENQLRLEAEAFAENIRQNTQPRAAGEEGLRDLLAMEAIYKAAGHPL
ncbi:MAG: Gfo/Idh/MocA family oxidoreductase [Acidobacteria bacterium]|nr:Gfo/Idh/MocA family oxidoreductase [Acidobacteriota bacterium]